MKTLLTLLSVLLLAATAPAQTGKLMKRYYISGSLAIGKDNRSFADSSSWIDIGPDTTDRGVRFPKVLLDSINTTQRALFVYDLQDSVLYHFDGTQRIRYMTYKDTVFFNRNFLAQGGNAYGKTVTVGAKDNTNVDVIANNNAVIRVFANGNVSIGGDTMTDNYAMNIDGTGDDGVLHLHKSNTSTFLKTTTNNDNAYTHTLAIGQHRIKTKGYGISFSAVDNEDSPNTTDMCRIKNVYNSTSFNPLKVLGANQEPYLTVNGVGTMLIGVPDSEVLSGVKAQVRGKLAVEEVTNKYKTSQPYLKISGDNNLLLESKGGTSGCVYLGMSGVSPDFDSVISSADRSGVVVSRDVTPITGSNTITYNGMVIKNKVDFANVTGSNVYRGILYSPTVTGNVEQRGVELNNTSGWGIYQPNSGVKNKFSGQTTFANGSLTDNNGMVTVSIGKVSNHKTSFWVTDNGAMDSDHSIAAFTTSQSPDIEYAVKASNLNSGPINLLTGTGAAFYGEGGELGFFKLNYLRSNNNFYGFYNNTLGQNGNGTTIESNAYSFTSGGQFAVANTQVGTVIDFWCKDWSSSYAGIIENRYGLKIDFNSTYINNAWGIYQTSSDVHNHFNGNTSFGSTANTAKVDITGSAGYDQLRLRTPYTPTSSSDTNGNVGDVSWDDGFIYIKTSAGWKRSQLLSF